jgi:hypothetical protein
MTLGTARRGVYLAGRRPVSCHSALTHFLEFGKQDPTLEWVRIDAFPREIVKDDRDGREAWERASGDRRRLDSAGQIKLKVEIVCSRSAQPFLAPLRMHR